jgi:hypothetical protein
MAEYEVWQRIPGLFPYEASSLGRIRTWTKSGLPRVLATTAHSSSPIPYFNPVVNGKRLTYRVHRAVLEAFVGPCPPGMEACHNDGDQLNNRPENLRWATHRDNMRDREHHGRNLKGSRHPKALLTESKVETVLWMLSCGVRVAPIARTVGVGYHVIENIASGKTWKHVERPPGLRVA